MKSLLLGLGLSFATAAAASAAVRLEAEASPSGRRPEARIVFAVTLENDAAPRSGTLVVEQKDVQAPRPVTLVVELAPQARKRLLVSFDTQPGGRDFAISFRSEGAVIAEQVLRLPTVGSPNTLVGVLGPVPGWLRRDADASLAAVELTPGLLPGDPDNWPDVDLILWPDPRTGDLEAPAAAVLRDWVRGGGVLLAGTAADQPRALEELGLGDWPPVAGELQAAGFGRAARSELDLARRAPPESLELRLHAEIPAGSRWRLSDVDPIERFVISQLAGPRRAPPAPAWEVTALLSLFLLLAGPGEWLLQRRSAKRGRRPRLALLRRLLLVGGVTGTVLVLCGGFADHSTQTVRVDVVDIDVLSGEARARAHVAVRRRAGGWQGLEVPIDAQLRAGRGSVSSQGRWWDGGDYEPERRFTATADPSARHRSARARAEAWATVSWTIRYEPDPALVAAARESARDPFRSWTFARFDQPLAYDASLNASQQGRVVETSAARARHCLQPYHQDAVDYPRLADCVLSGCDAVHGSYQRLRARHRPISEWPAGEGVLIAIAPTATGPELLIDGEQTKGPRYTVWRILNAPPGGRS